MGKTRHTPGERLHHLIQSLSPKAKEVFVKQANIGGNTFNSNSQKQYLLLFKAINAQKEYDEDALKKQFDTVNNFSQFRNNLKAKILEMFATKSGHPKSRLALMQNEIRELIEIGGDDITALDLTEKGIKEAQEYELVELLSEFYSFRDTLLESLERYETIREKAAIHQAESLDASYKTAILKAFEDGYQDYHRLLKEFYVARGSMEKKMIAPLKDHPTLSRKENAVLKRSQVYFYLLRYSVNLFEGDFEGCKENCLEVLQIFEEKPKLLELFKEEYVDILSSMASISQYLKEDKEVIFEYIDQLQAINSGSKKVKAKAFRGRFIAEVNYYYIHQEYEQVLGLLVEIDAGLKEYASYLGTDEVYFIDFWVGRACFALGNYREAKTWFEKIIDHPNKEVRRDLQSMARLMILMIWAEKEAGEAMDSETLSYRRWLRKEKKNRGAASGAKMFQFEMRLLKFFEKFPLPDNLKFKIKAYQKLAQDLEKILESKYEQRVLEYYDFSAWIAKRIADLKK